MRGFSLQSHHGIAPAPALHGRPGFSFLELLVILIVGAIIAGIALPKVVGVQARQDSLKARDTFVWTAARARQEALRRSTEVHLELNPLEKTLLVATAAGDTIELVEFANDFHATLTTSNDDAVLVCYNARGWAREGCTTPGLPITVTFSNASEQATAIVRALGQVDRQ